jgi:hypothetical protein
MEELRLFVSLRALGANDPGALKTLQAEVARLERELLGAGETIAPFQLDQEDLDNLYSLKRRQSLEPEPAVRRLAPARWVYTLLRKIVLGTQRRYNESATHLIRRLYSSALLTRYYQLRALALERRVEELEKRVAQANVEYHPKVNTAHEEKR